MSSKPITATSEGTCSPRSSSAVIARQRHVVVAGDQAVEVHPALVDEQLDGRFAGALLEVPLADERRIDGDPALGEDGAVDGVAALGLGVHRRPADEGDPPAAVARAAGARAPAASPAPRRASGRGRSADRAPGWPSAAAPAAPQSASTDDGPSALPSAPPRITAPSTLSVVAEIEHEVTVHPLGARRADHAAREDGQAHLAPAGGVGQAGQHRRLVGAAHRIEQHADDRPPILPLAAARARPFADGGRTRASNRSDRASASSPARCATPHAPFVPRAAGAAQLEKAGGAARWRARRGSVFLPHESRGMKSRRLPARTAGARPA